MDDDTMMACKSCGEECAPKQRGRSMTEPPLPDPPAPPRSESLLVSGACLVHGFTCVSLLLNMDNPITRGIGLASMLTFMLLMAAVIRLSNHTLALLGYALLLLERTRIIRAQYARPGKPDVTIH